MTGDFLEETYRHSFPAKLTLERTLCFAAALSELPAARNYLFDATELAFASPFGMLLAATALRRFSEAAKARNATTVCIPSRAEGLDYLSHMGFWKSFGAQLGKKPGDARGGEGYIPIRQLKTGELRGGTPIYGHAEPESAADAAERHAHDATDVLLQGAKGALRTTVGYAIRELFRNVFDHSRSPMLWYCGQYWPSQDRVEIAILDEGRGILASLRDNPNIAVSSEGDAIKLATQQGVSGVQAATNPNCPNSGDGLFVLRRVADHAGNFFILSNSEGVYFEGFKTADYSTVFAGTAIRIELRPSLLKSGILSDTLNKLEGKKPSRLTPSRLARLQ
ncbi:MAG: hypothetical protein U0570_10790 [Phycisphaerales bacterium]